MNYLDIPVGERFCQKSMQNCSNPIFYNRVNISLFISFHYAKSSCKTRKCMLLVNMIYTSKKKKWRLKIFFSNIYFFFSIVITTFSWFILKVNVFCCNCKISFFISRLFAIFKSYPHQLSIFSPIFFLIWLFSYCYRHGLTSWNNFAAYKYAHFLKR